MCTIVTWAFTHCLITMHLNSDVWTVLFCVEYLYFLLSIYLKRNVTIDFDRRVKNHELLCYQRFSNTYWKWYRLLNFFSVFIDTILSSIYYQIKLVSIYILKQSNRIIHSSLKTKKIESVLCSSWPKLFIFSALTFCLWVLYFYHTKVIKNNKYVYR